MTRVLCLVVATSVALVMVAPVRAVPYTSVKRINIEQNQTQSPFWGSGPDVADYAPAVGFYPNASSPAGGVFEPVGNPVIGDPSVTSITTRGTFNIAGNATSAGNWADGNGIPAGITLGFTAEFTVSVGAGSPPGSWLTAGSSSVALGIGQPIQGPTTDTDVYDSIDSVNLNDIEPDFIEGDADEYLNVSGVSVSSVSWTGALTEPGFQFSGGSVGNFGTYVLRANAFDESVETFGMFVEGAPTDPSNLNKPTIGFGGPSIHQSEQDAGYGTGVVLSHVPIENGFGQQTINGVSNWYPRQVGAWRFDPYNGTVAIKGIGYEYDVTFNVTTTLPGLPGDYNQNGAVDAADYVLWRNGDPAADGTGDTIVDQADYDFWAARFGNTSGSGTGSGGAVPEPATAMLVIVGFIGLVSRRGFAMQRSLPQY